MKVLAINGSARRGGNTQLLLETAIEPLRAAGIECEVVSLAGSDIRGCTACGRCAKERDGRCYGRSDDGNAIIEAMGEADGLLLGSPVYFADITAEMKALIDRAGYVGRSKREMFARKPGAAVIAVRRAGAIHAFDTLNHFFLIGEMMVVGSSYWNIGVGREKGEVAEDAEGLRTMARLGENLAWLLSKVHAE